MISADTNGAVTNYTYGLSRVSAMTGNRRTEYVSDISGSVIAEISGKLFGNNITVKTYTPFGETDSTSGFRYKGEYYDATTGQVYLRARFYTPEIGRFSQKDIEKGAITDALSLNRYTYVQNDPINFIDPSGMRQVEGVNPSKDNVSKVIKDNSAANAKVAQKQQQVKYESAQQKAQEKKLAARDDQSGTPKQTPKTNPPIVQSPVQERGKCGKKAAVIGIEIIKALFNSVEISAGIGQGIGASGSVKLGEDNVSFSLKTSANYAEFRIDDGMLDSGMSYSNEAYIGILTGKFGAAKNEISDWDGNWEIDDSSTFKGIVPETSVGFSVSAYFIVGISVDAEFNYIDFKSRMNTIG